MDNNQDKIQIPSREEAEAEVRKNYMAFSKMGFRHEDSGKFALLRDGKLVEILETCADAHAMGRALYQGIPYSVQEINPLVIDLGFMSHALCSDQD